MTLLLATCRSFDDTILFTEEERYATSGLREQELAKDEDVSAPITPTAPNDYKAKSTLKVAVLYGLNAAVSFPHSIRKRVLLETSANAFIHPAFPVRSTRIRQLNRADVGINHIFDRLGSDEEFLAKVSTTTSTSGLYDYVFYAVATAFIVAATCRYGGSVVEKMNDLSKRIRSRINKFQGGIFRNVLEDRCFQPFQKRTAP